MDLVKGGFEWTAVGISFFKHLKAGAGIEILFAFHLQMEDNRDEWLCWRVNLDKLVVLWNLLWSWKSKTTFWRFVALSTEQNYTNRMERYPQIGWNVFCNLRGAGDGKCCRWWEIMQVLRISSHMFICFESTCCSCLLMNIILGVTWTTQWPAWFPTGLPQLKVMFCPTCK